MRSLIPLLLAAGAGTLLAAEPSAPKRRGWIDANGNPRRIAATGHVTNYDEAKVGTYTLPDPLTLNDGRLVGDAATWENVRRPEILELYRKNIYGRVPENAPKPSFATVSVDRHAMGGFAVRQVEQLRFGDGPAAVRLPVTLYLPAHRAGPVPVLLQLVFHGEPAPTADPLGPVYDILARGYGYAFFTYTDLQPDRRGTEREGIEGLAASVGGKGAVSTRPEDGWGTISVWAWGASRVLDWLQTVSAVDARRVALVGHSRLGKTVLWAGAQDPRFALVFSSCAGEMGSALSRRDYGETVDDMAASFPWQFAPAFQQYVGHWDRMPVDAHMLIALLAPRPVFITAGTGDLWADPRGEFLAEVAASPAYRMLGEEGLGTDRFPAPGVTVASGRLAYREHIGPHCIMMGDWASVLDFADRFLKQ